MGLAERYPLRGALGAGATGSVWLAHDVAAGELVALKYFPPGRSGAGMREFTTRLPWRHPHIVGVRDFQYLPAGDACLVLDYANGGTLRAVMTPGAVWPAAAALAAGRDTLAALTHLHAHRITHGDVKPENILRAVAGDGAVVHRLTDFDVTPTGELQQAGDEIAGSPAYMAPERFRGESGPAADLYAVGVMLFELLAGDRPFHGTGAELARAHLSAPVPALPAEVPAEAALLVMQLLEKDPRRRLGPAAAVLSTVEALLGLVSESPAIAEPEPAAAVRGLTSLAGWSAAGQVTRVARAARAWLIESGGQPWLLADEGAHLSAFDLRHGTSARRLWPRAGETVQVQPDSAVWQCTGTGLLRWAPQTRAVVTVEADANRAVDFAVERGGGWMAWHDGRRITVRDPEGATAWMSPLPEAGSVWRLAWLGPGRLALAGGAMLPHVRLHDAAGRVLESVPLDGPLLEAPPGNGPGFWITQGTEPGRAAVTSIAADGQSRHRALPGRCAAYAWGVRELVVLAEDGVVRTYTTALEERVLGVAPLGAREIFVSPSQRFVAFGVPGDGGKDFAYVGLEQGDG